MLQQIFNNHRRDRRQYQRTDRPRARPQDAFVSGESVAHDPDIASETVVTVAADYRIAELEVAELKIINALFGPSLIPQPTLFGCLMTFRCHELSDSLHGPSHEFIRL